MAAEEGCSSIRWAKWFRVFPLVLNTDLLVVDEVKGSPWNLFKKSFSAYATGSAYDPLGGHRH